MRANIRFAAALLLVCSLWTPALAQTAIDLQLVLAVDAEGMVQPRIIRPGPSQPGGLRIVRNGLEPTDRIVINGLLRARPGAKVAPTEGTIEPDMTLGSGAGRLRPPV